MDTMEFPNWFSTSPAQNNFIKYLTPFRGMPEMNFLQLGAYTGDATVWLLENILTNPTSVLYDVDTWAGSDEEVHKSIDFNKVFDFYSKRTMQHTNLYYHRGTTLDYLRHDNKRYDFIYVDADHTAAGVLVDAELSWDLLKPNGLIAFDDYGWDSGKGAAYNPKLGIDLFFDKHKDDVRIIHIGYQVWAIKL